MPKFHTVHGSSRPEVLEKYKGRQGSFARWISIFSKFDFEISFRSREKKSVADYPSSSVEESKAMIMSGNLEEDLKAVVKYLSTGQLDGKSLSVRRAAKELVKIIFCKKNNCSGTQGAT